MLETKMGLKPHHCWYLFVELEPQTPLGPSLMTRSHSCWKGSGHATFCSFLVLGSARSWKPGVHLPLGWSRFKDLSHQDSVPPQAYTSFLSGEIPRLSWTKSREKDCPTYRAKEHLHDRTQSWNFLFWAFTWLLVYLRVNRSIETLQHLLAIAADVSNPPQGRRLSFFTQLGQAIRDNSCKTPKYLQEPITY